MLSRWLAGTAAHPFFSPLVLALLLTLLNCCGALQGDEDAYYLFARQIAAHPGDPYGFRYAEVPANHVLAPPVVLYWWAPALRLFGAHPALWKLWFLPFSLLFTFALSALLRRLCHGLETPLLWMIVLSPTILPSFNLMLDVPALALSLTAVALFLRAAERDSPWLAVLAGLVTGVAAQTKYTAFVTPVVLVLAGLLFGRLRFSLVAAGLAVAVFVGWEFVVARLYGESHFLHSLHGQPHSMARPFYLILPLVGILGGVAPVVGLLGLSALGMSRRGVLAGALAVALAYALVALVPNRGGAAVNSAVFGALGAGVCAVAALTAWRLVWGQREASPVRLDWFVVLWLGLELCSYFALTPIPGPRRLLGIVLVGTLLAGRLAARTCQARRALVGAVAAANVVLGLGLFALEAWDTRAEWVAVRLAARLVRQRPAGAAVWYQVDCIGGFGAYARLAGMRRWGWPDQPAPRSGDWVVMLYRPVTHTNHDLALPPGEPIARFQIADPLPLRIVACYRSAVAHQEGPRALVDVYRVP